MKHFFLLGLLLARTLSFNVKEILEKVTLIRCASLETTDPFIRSHRLPYLLQTHLLKQLKAYSFFSTQFLLSKEEGYLGKKTLEFCLAKFIFVILMHFSDELIPEQEITFFEKITRQSEGLIHENLLLSELKANYPIPFELSDLIPRKYMENFEGLLLKTLNNASGKSLSELELLFMADIFFGNAFGSRCMVNALLSFRGILTAKKYLSSSIIFPFSQKQRSPKVSDVLKFVDDNVQAYYILKERIFEFSFLDSAITLSFVYNLFAYLSNIAVLWNLNHYAIKKVTELEQAHMDFLTTVDSFSREILSCRKLIKSYHLDGFRFPGSEGNMTLMPSRIFKEYISTHRVRNFSRIDQVFFYRVPSDKPAALRLSKEKRLPSFDYMTTCACIKMVNDEHLLVYTCNKNMDERFIDRMVESMKRQAGDFVLHYETALKDSS